jgi:hypothetical protein
MWARTSEVAGVVDEGEVATGELGRRVRWARADEVGTYK